MEIERLHPTGPIKLHQKLYIETLVERFGLPQGILKDKLPFEPNLHLELGPMEPDPAILFRELVGGLLYLLRGSRPDLAYYVGYCSRFMSTYAQVHIDAAMRILQYAYQTRHYGLYYDNNVEVDLEGYFHGYWPGDTLDAKCTMSYLFSLGMNISSPITWKSKKQPVATK